MRIRSYGAIFLLAASWSACQQLSTIQLREESTTTIERGSLLEDFVGDLGFGEFLNMDIMDSTELRNQGVEPGDIREVFLTNLQLEVTDPAGGDLSFLESVEFYVEGPDLPRQRLAWQDTFPEGQSLVVFELEPIDLTDYAVAESMSITTSVNGRRPDERTTVDALVEIAVGVTAQGACNQLDRN